MVLAPKPRHLAGRLYSVMSAGHGKNVQRRWARKVDATSQSEDVQMTVVDDVKDDKRSTSSPRGRSALEVVERHMSARSVHLKSKAADEETIDNLSTCSTGEQSVASEVAERHLKARTVSLKPRLEVVSQRGTICVIGGGPSGLGCCRTLCDAGFDVTLVQESRGLGGKLCTKFVNGKDDPTLHFDMGVQLLRPHGEISKVLGSIVKPWPAAGRFKLVKCDGDWNEWWLVSTSDVSTENCVVGVPSMSAIGRHLADQCKNLTIHLDQTAHVRSKDSGSCKWEVEWKREAPTGNQLRYRPELRNVPAKTGGGEFDSVVLAFEANKISRGCKSGYKMTAPSATAHIQNQTRLAKTCQIWNLMVAFDEELQMPWDAACVEGHPAISWVAVDSSKPERARVPECYMVFSTQAWASWKQWSTREVEAELLKEFVQFLKVVLGRRVPKPCFVLGGRWGNSTDRVLTGVAPSGEFPMRALDFSDKPSVVVWDERKSMGATGDWSRGFSVSDAYEAGVDLATEIIERSRK